MNRCRNILFFCLTVAVNTVLAQPDQWKSELEVNTDYIQSKLDDKSIDLNQALRGVAGLEVNVYFRTNSTQLDYLNRQRVIKIARLMWVYPMVSVSLGGHTDSRGSSEYNRRLAKQRVDAVHELIRSLLSDKYHSRRVNMHAYGESFMPHDQNDTEGMAFDRRVSILVLVPGK